MMSAALEGLVEFLPDPIDLGFLMAESGEYLGGRHAGLRTPRALTFFRIAEEIGQRDRANHGPSERPDPRTPKGRDGKRMVATRCSGSSYCWADIGAVCGVVESLDLFFLRSRRDSSLP